MPVSCYAQNLSGNERDTIIRVINHAVRMEVSATMTHVTRRSVSAPVGEWEAGALERLAAENDRTLSREVARAIRFYLSHPEAATTRPPVEQDMHAP